MDRNRGLGRMRRMWRRPIRSRRSCGDVSGRSARACRLPPRGIRSIDSVRAVADGIHIRYLVRRYAGDVVIVGLVLSLLVTMTISSFGDYSPQVSVSEIAPLTGTRGWGTTNCSCESTTSVHLIKNISLDNRSGWQVDHHRVGNNPWLFLNDSAGSDRFQLSIADSVVYLTRRLCLPIQDYESINISLEARVSSGSASLELGLQVLKPNGYFAVNGTAAEIDTGQTETLVVGFSLGELKSEYPEYWFMQAWVVVVISAEEHTVVAIPSLDFEARSSQTLSPVTISIQATNGQTLLSNPYHWEEGYWEHNSLYLLLNVFRPDDGKSATIDMWLANETFYLPQANYSVRAAWSRYGTWSDDLDNESAELDIRENQSTVIRMRLPSILLRIEVSPNMVSGSLFVTADGRPVYDYGFDIDTNQSIHVPAWVTELHVSAFQVSYWGHFGEAHLQYKPDGLSSLLVTIDYPYVVLLGVIMTGLDMIAVALIATLIIAVLVRFSHEFIGRTTKSVLSDPWSIPFVLVLAGGLLPWFSYTSTIQWGRLDNITQHDYLTQALSGAVIPQLALITRQTPFGSQVPYALELWPFLVPPFLVFFWIPVLGILRQMGSEEAALSWERLVCIVCPVALALASWLAAAVVGWVPDVGLWMVLFSPAALFISVMVPRAFATRRMVATDT